MGFWSAVGNFVKSAGKALVGTVVGGIGSLVSEAVSWIKENILGLNETPSYDPETATVDETKKINELIEKCIEGYSKESKECDRETKEIIEEHFQEIVSKLKEINKEEEIPIIEDYIFDIFEMRVEEVKRSLNNIYSKQISNVFSLNNSNLLDILRMDKGIEKKNRLNNLAKSTLKRAYQKIKDVSEEAINEQQKFIMEKLLVYIENRQNLLETSKRETENILKKSGEDRGEFLELQTKYDKIEKKLNLLGDLMEA
ncbi:hypothetical protein KST23_03075 [Fusobacterium nucleatum]|uniref:hypothetical protein n=1 Tax=Fusobacterium nucleatum TaxID=851 RepID=UPI003D023440